MDKNSMIEKLQEGRILRVSLSDDKKNLNFEEGCDHYFNVDLTKSEVFQLIEELKELANKL